MNLHGFLCKKYKDPNPKENLRFVNTNPRKFENLYILLGFINTIWISKSIKIYKPITPPKCRLPRAGNLNHCPRAPPRLTCRGADAGRTI